MSTQTTRGMEFAMPAALPQWFDMVITILVSLLTGLGAVYLAWKRIIKMGTQTTSDISTLKLIDAAVAHWKELHEEAWEQVKAERERREKAETRLQLALDQIESLRSEVAALRRDIEKLTATPSKPEGDPYDFYPPQV